MYSYRTKMEGSIWSVTSLPSSAAGLWTSKTLGPFRTDSIEIGGDSHIQIDGDYAGKTPAKIDVVKNALKLIVPKK